MPHFLINLVCWDTMPVTGPKDWKWRIIWPCKENKAPVKRACPQPHLEARALPQVPLSVDSFETAALAWYVREVGICSDGSRKCSGNLESCPTTWARRGYILHLAMYFLIWHFSLPHCFPNSGFIILIKQFCFHLHSCYPRQGLIISYLEDWNNFQAFLPACTCPF